MLKLYTMLIAFSMLFSSCFIARQDLSYKLRFLEIGMELKEVTAILRGNYLITDAYKNRDGRTIKTLTYAYGKQDDFHFIFIDDKLDSWNRERLPQPLITAPNNEVNTKK